MFRGTLGSQNDLYSTFFSANGTGTDKRNGAASDCESDDGEEGDYTVYECPGLAPVGFLICGPCLFRKIVTSPYFCN